MIYLKPYSIYLRVTRDVRVFRNGRGGDNIEPDMWHFSINWGTQYRPPNYDPC